METLRLHARQETFRKEFPTLLKRCGFMPNGKLFTKGFLLRENAFVSCRTGNYLQRVSYSAETLRLHAKQETFRKGFPARHDTTGPSFPQETLGIPTLKPQNGV